MVRTRLRAERRKWHCTDGNDFDVRNAWNQCNSIYLEQLLKFLTWFSPHCNCMCANCFFFFFFSALLCNVRWKAIKVQWLRPTKKRVLLLPKKGFNFVLALKKDRSFKAYPIDLFGWTKTEHIHFDSCELIDYFFFQFGRIQCVC